MQALPISKLPTEEVDLAKCPKTERTVCWWYEIAREVVEDDKKNGPERLDDLVCTLRHDAEIKNFDSLAASRLPFLGLLGLGPLGVLLLYEEWPKTPYLAIPQAERTRRLKAYPKPSMSASIKASLITGRQEPVTPETYRPGKPVARNTYLSVCPPEPRVTIQIPSWATPKQLRESFAAFLEVYFPNRPRSRKQGRQASKLALEDDIYGLIAYRLCKRAGMTRAEAVMDIRNAKGQKIYTSSKALDKPLNRAAKRLRGCRESLSEELDVLRKYLEQMADCKEKIESQRTEIERLKAEQAELKKPTIDTQ